MRGKTDGEVEQGVLRELSLREKVCSREICVLARDGVVRLQGSAQSDEDKLAIEETIGRAAGVVRVVNELRVNAVVALIKRMPMSVPLTGAVSQPCQFIALQLNIWPPGQRGETGSRQLIGMLENLRR
jgi:hypothetical protein